MKKEKRIYFILDDEIMKILARTDKIIYQKLLLFFSLFSILILGCSDSTGPGNNQGPNIEWQKSFGGENRDWAYSALQTFDGGLIIAGMIEKRYDDYFEIGIIKLNHSGNIVWQNSVHVTEYIYHASVQEKDDGGYIVVSNSQNDIICINLSKDGSILNTKYFGGSWSDEACSIQKTKDGGFIIAGTSGSTNLPNHHEYGDIYLLKLSSNLNMEWHRCYGGNSSDEAADIRQTLDGGYIIAGFSQSSDGDLTPNHGSSDVWIFKIDQSGNIQWQRSYGGSEWDEVASIDITTDGGYIFAGRTSSDDGDVIGNTINTVCWTVKLDVNGEIEWQKCLENDLNNSWAMGNSIMQTLDGGYIMAASHAAADFWIVKFNSKGNIEWQKSIGGKGSEEPKSIIQTSDGGYIVAGASTSGDAGISNNGLFDMWIVKLK